MLKSPLPVLFSVAKSLLVTVIQRNRIYRFWILYKEFIHMHMKDNNTKNLRRQTGMSRPIKVQKAENPNSSRLEIMKRQCFSPDLII